MTETPLFARGTGQWEGVVMIERPDLTKMSHGENPMCHVQSAKMLQLNGYAAIDTYLPYALFARYFNSGDGDHIFAEAEFKDGHLEVYGRARTNIKEWVLYGLTQEQSGGVCDAYQ